MDMMRWVEHLNAMQDRMQHHDVTLTHLQPYPTQALLDEQSSLTVGNSEESLDSQDQHRLMSVSRNSSMFQMMVLFDDLQVQAALTRLWKTCATACNRNVKQVTLPASWPASDVRRALDALGGLRELQRVEIIVDTDQWESELDDEGSQSFARNTSLRAWHASSLEITDDILPFLARRVQISTNVHIPPAMFRGLQHLRLDNRLIVRTQAEIDHLAGLLSQFVHLKFLSLFLSSKSAGADQALALDPLFDTLNQLSRKTPLQQKDVETETGLQILCLQWSDLFHAHQAVVSANVLEKFLQYQLDHSDAISTIRKLSLCGLYLGSGHMEAVAKALRGNIVLEDLTLSGHNMKYGGVTPSCLHAILEVLENQNHTLKNISVYSFNEAQLSFSNTWHRSDIPSAASARPPPHHATKISVDSNGNDDDHTQCCRLQEQMEIFCDLNRLGRATLVIPNATADDWVKMIAKCTADVCRKSMDKRNLSRLVSRANHLRNDDGDGDDYTFQNQSHDHKEMIGLDEVFLLLRMYPSLFYAGDRPAFDSSIPPEL